jgi:hypothetical protein
MTEALETKLEIKSWDEKPTEEFPDGSRLAQAVVHLVGADDAINSATFLSLLYYRPDGTSSYVSLMHLDASLSGRSGSVTLQGAGTYDGSTAQVDCSVIEGSGTDGLAGMSGAAQSVSTHQDYPFMPLTFRYDVE